jgi:hypothetical protein
VTIDWNDAEKNRKIILPVASKTMDVKLLNTKISTGMIFSIHSVIDGLFKHRIVINYKNFTNKSWKISLF